MSFLSVLHVSMCVLRYFLHFSEQGRQESLIFNESSHDTNKLSIRTNGNDNAYNSGNAQSAVTPRGSSLSSSQLLLQRRQFAEAQIGKTSFQKLLEPSSSQLPGIAPYRVVLGDVKEKVLNLSISSQLSLN